MPKRVDIGGAEFTQQELAELVSIVQHAGWKHIVKFLTVVQSIAVDAVMNNRAEKDLTNICQLQGEHTFITEFLGVIPQAIKMLEDTEYWESPDGDEE